MNTDTTQPRQAWIDSFAQRLAARWPHLDSSDAEHVGEGLWREDSWRSIEPTLAAELWMAQVMAPPRPPRLAAAGSGAAS